MNNERVYDVVGVGFGPANLALAIAMEEGTFDGKVRFFERKPEALWQDQMLLKGSDIQNNPARDLVTPRNPRSRYSFLNFLFENNRLYEHLNLSLDFPLRAEFAQYVRWVAGFFQHLVDYNSGVQSIHYLSSEMLFKIVLESGEVHLARSIVVAPGRTPRVPSVYRHLDRNRTFHLTEYKRKIDALAAAGSIKKIAVIGGSQSAIEIMLDLHARFPKLEIHNIQRGFGFRLKDESQFSGHVYFPSFVDYYYESDQAAKRRINRHLHYTNYSAADADVIKELYVTAYEDKISGIERVFFHGFSETEIAKDDVQGVQLRIKEINRNTRDVIKNLDAVILATGFCDLGSDDNSELCPAILESLYPALLKNDESVIVIDRDYSLAASQSESMGPIYLNGLCESSHGYGDAGSFSLLSIRSKTILDSLTAHLGSASRISQKVEAL